jgi:hypothetical protein
MAWNTVIESLAEAASKNRQNKATLDLPPQVRFNILSILLLIIPSGVSILIAVKTDNSVIAIIGILLG